MESKTFCQMRFLYAAVDYPSLSLSVNHEKIIEQFPYGSISPYFRKDSGIHELTVTASDFSHPRLYHSALPFSKDSLYTITVINSHNGLFLLPLNDSPCSGMTEQSYIRVCNLSPDSCFIDVLLSDGRVISDHLPYQGISPWRAIGSGIYRMLAIMSTKEYPPVDYSKQIEAESKDYINYVPGNDNYNLLTNASISVSEPGLYTLYIIGSVFHSPSIQFLSAHTPICTE